MNYLSVKTNTELEEILITCPNCRKELVLLVVNKDKKGMSGAFFADCGWCKQRSFRADLTNVSHFSATKHCRVIDIENSPEGHTIFKTMKGNNSGYGEF